jgi:hypothetical protein
LAAANYFFGNIVGSGYHRETDQDLKPRCREKLGVDKKRFSFWKDNASNRNRNYYPIFNIARPQAEKTEA